jgi:P pilus assembly protein, chaperone PapD
MKRLSSKLLWRTSIVAVAMLCSGLAQAGIVIQGSRVVYPAKDREVTVKMANMADEPSLVQAWVDKGNAELRPEQADGPFLVTPPITRVEGNKGQTLRLVYTGDDAVGKKQETVFWLNVLDVPPMPKDKDANFLQVAVRSRLKIFYRPDGLPGNPTRAAEELKWSATPSGVRVRNDSAFNVSLSSIQVEMAGKPLSVKPENVKMVAPGTSMDFPVQGLAGAPAAGSKLTYEWVSDYGAVNRQESKL